MDGKALRVTILREGSLVARCHTFPHLQPYTVGSHTFGMIGLLLELHPCPTLELVEAITWHDIHERYTGDVPSPVTRNGHAGAQAFGDAHDKVQKQIQEDFGLSFDLSPEDRHWIKALDRLELWLWALEAVALGNTVATEMVVRLNNWFWAERENIPIEIQMFKGKYFHRRTPEIGEHSPAWLAKVRSDSPRPRVHPEVRDLRSTVDALKERMDGLIRENQSLRDTVTELENR